ncbi:uncharacterized protein M421DRAFT_425144 [Didymella exigua CBS 183.55]|uniref:Uncharacterized protein n=1 Tax=Didymella exigua CBS 183.55 TaxID=1150837 RepID=A0A6A5REL1_9PLEO|nr:uncharacterized protein M421DRAFT_425144 [Didymella exigua CBS 183.55]KAF1924137.1 hypothetical protein M421DRAFT_425144 [Didymella exigua CBS 183.55]
MATPWPQQPTAFRARATRINTYLNEVLRYIGRNRSHSLPAFLAKIIVYGALTLIL